MIAINVTSGYTGNLNCYEASGRSNLLQSCACSVLHRA
jgi:hypothetical protein